VTVNHWSWIAGQVSIRRIVVCSLAGKFPVQNWTGERRSFSPRASSLEILFLGEITLGEINLNTATVLTAPEPFTNLTDILAEIGSGKRPLPTSPQYKPLTQDEISEMESNLVWLNAMLEQEKPSWRKRLRTRSELQRGPIEFFIKGFLPEGITFLGGLSGSGKSWLALSMAKSLTTGKIFLGCFEVPEVQNVIYLAPESGEKSLRTRLDIVGMPEERFFCTTVNEGGLKLNDGDLVAAVQELKPIVFLDTAIRFLNGAEENSASATSASLADAIFALLKSGAKAVVGVHHSPKSSAGTESLTLENSLRGTGDIGAMCDAVYAIRCLDQETLTVKVSPVKARDFEPVKPFEIQGRPYLNEIGSFGLLAEPVLFGEEARIKKLVETIERRPKASYRELADITGIAKSCIGQFSAKAGWKQDNGLWIRDALSSS
jgi:hypothetical protein